MWAEKDKTWDGGKTKGGSRRKRGWTEEKHIAGVEGQKVGEKKDKVVEKEREGTEIKTKGRFRGKHKAGGV